MKQLLTLLLLSTASVAIHAAEGTAHTSVGGYGEINYNNYSKRPSQNQMDLRRFVLSVEHRFNEELSFVGEMEWEHAITSADDEGEAAIEQAHLNYRLLENLNLKAGLFLMPFGFLNESHEPPTYYGVERNEVETRIIPTTWREGGLGLYGNTEMGIDWSVGAVTGFNVAKFDGPDEPLGSIHQELAKAKASDIAFVGAINYRVPGLNIGTAFFSGNSTQSNATYNEDNANPSFAGIDGRVCLGDVHARWQGYGLDVQALIAKGSISDAKEINSRIEDFNTANPGSDREFVPEEFYGWYVQAAYGIALNETMKISPFGRYEYYDTQSKMSPGHTADKANRDSVTTLGLSFHPHNQVVFKTDYQTYNDNTERNRFNLGMGYMF